MKLLTSLLLILVVVWETTANAELVVIANKNLDTSDLSKKKIIDIYMGRHALSLNGIKLTPLDQADGSDAKAYFYQAFVNKKLNQINAYWARLLFSGRGKPPMMVETEEEIINIIIHNATMIGYVDSSKLTADEVSNQIKIIANVD